MIKEQILQQLKFDMELFSTNELDQIAEALDCEFEGFFVDKNGERI